MIINKNVSLKGYNTFGLNYLADCIIHLKNEKEAKSVFDGSVPYKKPLIIIGGGSNLLFTGDFKGTIIHPVIRGIRLVKEEGNIVIISAGADVKWDNLVEWSVERGFSGLENLSLIPGSVGASAVQNIGAYGVEVKDSVVKVKTVDISDGTTRVFLNSECEFGYRSSVFKKRLKGKYLVTRVYFRLKTSQILNLGYGSLKEEVLKLGGPELKNVRKAVIKIRESKLPDPEIIGNAGSFFKNPVVSKLIAENIKKDYPEVPVYDESNGLKKIAAGWLIEKCGWKGKREGDAGVHENQALVLVNHGKASGKDIYKLSEMIKKSVLDKFGIELEREVEVIGPI